METKHKFVLVSQDFVAGQTGWSLDKYGNLLVWSDGCVGLTRLSPPAPQSVGSLVYELKIDTEAATSSLEEFKKAVEESGFSGPFVITGCVVEAHTIKASKISEASKVDRDKLLVDLTFAAVSAGKDADYAADCATRAVNTLFPVQE